MKKLRNTLLILLLMFGCLGFSRNVQAETLLREKTVTIESYGDKTLYSFKIDGESVWYVCGLCMKVTLKTILPLSGQGLHPSKKIISSRKLLPLL